MPDTEQPPKKCRWLLRATMAALVVLVGLAGGTAYRLTRAPIVLPEAVVDRIEQRLNRDLGQTRVTLSEVALAYDVTDQVLALRTTDVTVDSDGAEVLRLPDARVLLDGPSLLRLTARPRAVDLSGLALDVARDADGRINLSFGQAGNGGLPATWAEGLQALDTILALPVVAELDQVDVTGITIRLRDAITGVAQDLSDGTVSLRRDGEGTRVALSLAIPTGGGRQADLALTLQRSATARGAQANLALLNLPLSYLSDTVTNVPALSLVRGDVSATAAFTVDESGTAGPLLGRLEVRDAELVDRKALALDRAVLGFGWVPGEDRITLTEISGGSDDLSFGAEGQIILEDGLIGPVQVQLRLGETVFNPEDLFEDRVAFDSGVFEARLTQAPLGLHLGQAMVTGPSGTARLSGRIRFPEGGLAGQLRLAVPRMEVNELKALWPPEFRVQSRTWFVNNMIGGEATDLVGGIQLAPGQEPEVSASFTYAGGQVRYMRFMPPAENARGAAQFDGNRLAMRVDSAVVPAVGPGEEITAQTPRIRINGTRFVIPDATAKPARGELSMRASGNIPDVMAMLNNRPLRLLDRLKKDRDFATGVAEALVEVQLPLRKGNAPADIDWSVQATLRDVATDDLVPGRSLRSRALEMTATPAAVEIGGNATFEGIPFAGSWRQALPPRSTRPIDPEAPPPPPVPLPEPGRVTGSVELSPEGLARLGVDLSALSLRGQTRADIAMNLPQGAAPSLSLSSRLAGLSVALPAISWSKPAGQTSDFSLRAQLGNTPRVEEITLSAQGLTAKGAVRLRDGGGLDVAEFSRVDTGWFSGPLTLTGRGRGTPPAIAILGGSADLRRALLNSGSGGSGAGNRGSPLTIALDRLTVSEGLALTDLRATLRNGTGQFTGRLNGGAAVEGVLAPQGGSSAVQIRGADAGGVLQSAGLFQDARGGDLNLTLRPTGQAGVYAGALRINDLRVRNAPALASLLQALSVVGILEQLAGEGLFFGTVESDFTLRPGDIVVSRASAVGPSMSITADGVYDIGTKVMDLQGVISPIYLVNGLFGALFSRRDEGLFGFTYRMRGVAQNPQVSVNPLSILTPGVFREIFRRPPPEG